MKKSSQITKPDPRPKYVPADVPVVSTFLSDKPNQMAVNVIMESIQKFCVEERLVVDSGQLSVAEAAS